VERGCYLEASTPRALQRHHWHTLFVPRYPHSWVRPRRVTLRAVQPLLPRPIPLHACPIAWPSSTHNPAGPVPSRRCRSCHLGHLCMSETGRRMVMGAGSTFFQFCRSNSLRGPTWIEAINGQGTDLGKA
jgi:hypothetical protein